ncbi:hypothetical protein C8Q72DRAFT_443639 [Fomitopsis betulina]|nr:hypothetical protein C8Q72DRAFT_443639 [Fomitopsis betulina]
MAEDNSRLAEADLFVQCRRTEPSHHYLHIVRPIVCTANVFLTTRASRSFVSVVSLYDFSAYQPSQAAINRFTEFVHHGYADKGVRVFAYHPGVLPRTPPMLVCSISQITGMQAE